MLTSILYVSRARLDGEADVERIVAASRLSNAANEITGALLYTGVHFAQWLEGEDAVLDALLERIAADGRHRDLLVIAREPAERRSFGPWSMAYAGPSFYADRQIRALYGAGAPQHRSAAIAKLREVVLRTVSGEGFSNAWGNAA